MPKGAISERLAERMVEKAQYSGLIQASFEMRSKLFVIFDSLSYGEDTPRKVAVLAAADLALELCGTSSLIAQQLAANSLRAMHQQQIHFLLVSAWHVMRSTDDAVNSVSGFLKPCSAGALAAIRSDRDMALSIAWDDLNSSEPDDLVLAIVRLYEHTQDTLSARINQPSGAEIQHVIDLIQGFNAAAVLATRVVARICSNGHEVSARVEKLAAEYRECFPVGDTWDEPFLDFTGFGNPGRSLLPVTRI